ncbi:Cof-type HAD-IIB family hydrolase [Weissella sagaensis]|jgi:Cof subfamily protein (haloacid dehalogenase superfamily)|uniref:Cof-type HAD-IIB family hydrolase n=1 Tax=Weissella sagaensis TaxID=2559928 RepID=A0ABW1RT92_9LACO|nr:Cof-type HAD-IIB family hydrolase [Weissella sagaensis]MBU7568350.1 Cof-type HAD-IIB family hydrolase [Weissella hellenica]QDJ59116.1 Cof-type HAD-IIB family hydrolase [Weissella hellenica]
MTYKMLVSDLDETFLNDDGTIHEENVQTVKKAAAQGFKFVPNTGRSFESVQKMLKQLDLYDQVGQFVISFNGSAIVENKDNQIIATQDMPLTMAKQIFKAGLINEAVDVHIYTIDKLFIYNVSDSDRQYLATRGVAYVELKTPDLSFLNRQQPIMKVIFEHSDMQVRHQIYDAVIDSVGIDQVEATYSSDRYVEFNLKGVDKGTASLLLGEKLGIKRDEIMAIGDNNNDLKMIKAAGLGISVANGITAVKEMADIVTTRTNNEGAIAEVLNQFVLIGE